MPAFLFDGHVKCIHRNRESEEREKERERTKKKYTPTKRNNVVCEWSKFNDYISFTHGQQKNKAIFFSSSFSVWESENLCITFLCFEECGTCVCLLSRRQMLQMSVYCVKKKSLKHCANYWIRWPKITFNLKHKASPWPW